MKKIFLLILILFSAFSFWGAGKYGYFSFFEVFKSAPSTQVFLDLVIALNLFIYWMVLDNKNHGHRFIKILPFIIVTFFLGSMGPLLYLVLRKDQEVFIDFTSASLTSKASHQSRGGRAGSYILGEK